MTRVALASILLLPTVAMAASPRTFQELVNVVVTNINALTFLLILAGVVIYFYGLSTNILKFGEDHKKFRNYFFWGIIILFVMVSLWGILVLLRESLFGSSATGTSNTQQNQVHNIVF